MAPGATPSDLPPAQSSQIATTFMVSSDLVFARNGISVKHGVANNQCASRTLLPFAHRVIITRELKGLQPFLPMSIVKPYPKEDGGWRFPTTDDEYPGSTIDHLFHSKFLHEVYFKSNSQYKGKHSVPVLWDKKTNQIVNNESEDITRMLNTVYSDHLPKDDPRQKLNFYPPELKHQIDEINSWMSPGLNRVSTKQASHPHRKPMTLLPSSSLKPLTVLRRS